MSTRKSKSEIQAAKVAEYQAQMQQEATNSFMTEIGNVITNAIKDGIEISDTYNEIILRIKMELGFFKERKIFQIEHNEELQQIAMTAFEDIGKALHEEINKLYPAEGE